MPNKKSAIKHLRQTEKLTKRNALVKRNIREIIKSGKKAISAGNIDKKSGELIHTLQKAVDKAVKSNIIKVNTGNRKKQRFAAMIKQAGAKPVATKPKAEEKSADKK
ncbi:30S ribosomal protein S20 [Candidatus Parcubacteria bacterium]|jgi:ribosomal protein S20|nr:30S ribosomal protein S20 [Candidatus Parcubacteria bacterium]